MMTLGTARRASFTSSGTPRHHRQSEPVTATVVLPVLEVLEAAEMVERFLVLEAHQPEVTV